VVDIRSSIVCLQETKLCSISDFNILSILGSRFSNFVYSPAVGTRGVLLSWRDGTFSSVASIIKQFSVSVKFHEGNGDCRWFTGVYGPHQDNLKLSFLQELREIRDECEGPWIIGGDFNMIFIGRKTRTIPI
jgi:exonuclease III